MALRNLSKFNELDKHFDPDDTTDKSQDNLIFNAPQVEAAYNTALSSAAAFNEKVSGLGSKIAEICDAGFTGTTITGEIQNYIPKMNECAGEIENQKALFKKAVDSRLEQMTTGEKEAGTTAEVGSSTQAKAGDQIMAQATDYEKWAQSELGT